MDVTRGEQWKTPMTRGQLRELGWDQLAPGKPARLERLERAEGFINAFDGSRLFWQQWTARDAAPEEARGIIFIMHGYDEHSTRYEHIAGALVLAGYAVFAIDARGHGRSEGKPNHVEAFDDYVRDLERGIAKAREELGDAPLFVLGHSNGGLIALRYALRRPKDVVAFVVSSPLCGLAVKVPGWKAAAGKVMSRLIPKFSMPSGITPDAVSRNEDVVRDYDKDPFVRGIATARYFTESTWATADLYERAKMVEHPMLFIVAGNDRLVDAQAAERVFHRLGSSDREFELYDELYHEILNEPEWQDVLLRSLEWIERQRSDYIRFEAGEEE